ncbi:unnamed protein product [Candida verbasci]|uniref:Uncharacterized protein n=1 Tax=Candida verbasci TaxID=1227364 RepID=A0A9W4XGM3_9ASCO|nr:unnamed protein product [Candida verbasci]
MSFNIPIVTIPESSYNPSSYNTIKTKSQLIIYLTKLTHGSSIFLILFYLIGYFAIKPLLEITITRRLELLETTRLNLRDCYIKLISKVNYIPIIKINKNGKIISDEIIQTDDNNKNNKYKDDENNNDEIYLKLKRLSNLLSTNIRSYDAGEFLNFKSIKYSIKDFQNKSDLIYFNEDELFTVESNSKIDDKNIQGIKKKNISIETKNEIRSIKGLFMSGQA